MKMTGMAFVHTAVEGVITKIVEMKQSCEVTNVTKNILACF